MDKIIKFLKSFGLTDEEISKVLKDVPARPEGLMGTNVTKGIFEKGGKKEFSEHPLFTEEMLNPFISSKYRGKTRAEVLDEATKGFKFLEDEITKASDLILNQNITLTPKQRETFLRNLQMKRNFEKDLEKLRSQPEAPVLDIKTGKKYGEEGIESLKSKAGTQYPPTTPIGKIESQMKQLENEMTSFVDDFLDPEKMAIREEQRKKLLARQYEGKGYGGDILSGPSGIYRMAARDYLLDQAEKGIIKLNPRTIENLQNRNYISGGQPLMYEDPIRVMRYHYGDDVFDKIPVDELSKTSGAKSDILNAMSKVDITPVKVEPPKNPGGYMTPGEIEANIEELKGIEDMVMKRQSRFAGMSPSEIENELGQYFGQRESFEKALEIDHPEAFNNYLDKKLEPYVQKYEGRDPREVMYDANKILKGDLHNELSTTEREKLADKLGDIIFEREPKDEFNKGGLVGLRK